MSEKETREFAARLRALADPHDHPHESYYKAALANAADFIEQQEDHHREHHRKELEFLESEEFKSYVAAQVKKELST